jgi:putative glutamine amidotransferase
VRLALIGVSPGFTDYGDYIGIAFSRPLERLGAAAVVLPYSERPRELLAHLDGLLLAGGRDIDPARFGSGRHPKATPHSPLRDEFELALVPAAISAGIPLLGICRGMQIINVALGGTLYGDHGVLPPPANRHPGGDWERWAEVVRTRLGGRRPPPHPSHEVRLEPGTALRQVLGPRVLVNSYHHQSIAQLGRGLVASARAPDGVIEAIELPSADSLCLGVQWEEQEQPQTPVFSLLVRAARERVASGSDGTRIAVDVSELAGQAPRASG